MAELLIVDDEESLCRVLTDGLGNKLINQLV
jgi:hypothetical protein